uniref:Olfactory receptor family 5 subfamily M member 12 n=1 Tax=Nannospalax galili TaxID=1026970 RepID=A0A8C6QVZ5_NANGA
MKKPDPKHNGTKAAEFILLGLNSRPELQPILFVVFLLIYLITLTGNFGMIFLIRFTSRLKTLRIFSSLTFCFTNVSPQVLVNFLSEKSISYIGYLAHSMAYDSYMAIYNPLHYRTKMSHPICICLVTFPSLWGSMVSTVQVILTSCLFFCGPNTINHVYCADLPLLMLACSDTYIKQTSLFVSAGINLTASLLNFLISYIFIFRSAFSTCGSHLTALVIFYGSLFCMYLRPENERSVEQGKIMAAFYVFVSPVLNPFIYSLRNRHVKQSLRRVFIRNLGKIEE